MCWWNRIIPRPTLRRCREKLAEGASVHFYPEGTRSPDGFVQRFHRGAFELAVELAGHSARCFV